VTMSQSDRETLQEHIRSALQPKLYDVAHFYHPYDESLFTRIATNQVFENLTLLVIGFNALWMAIDTDLNTAEVLLSAKPVFQIAEHFFCLYFSLEWFIRFMAFKIKRNGMKDGWFVFDTCLVVMMFGETWVMTGVLLLTGGAGGGGLGNASMLRMARLLRLSRMARMARLFRAMPELLILVKGMGAAMRSVFFVLCLLMIVMYVFAIVFRQLTDGTQVGSEYFNSVPQAMHSLLLHGTLLDAVGDRVNELMEVSFVLVGVFYLFVLLSALTVLNMLIGVLCEVVSGVATTERENLSVSNVRARLVEIVHASGIDEDGSGCLSKAELSKILDIPVAVKTLAEVGVDVFALVDNIDYIYESQRAGPEDEEEMELDFETFMRIILDLRGCNQATLKDIMDLKKYMVNTLKDQREGLADEVRRMLAPNARQPSNAPPSTPPVLALQTELR